MNQIFFMKHINFLIVFNIFLILITLSYCGGQNTLKEQIINFKIEKAFYSDNDNSPYFFVGIHEICANSKYIYVSDWKEYSIKIFDLDLNLIKKIGKKGGGPGEFSQIFADLKCNEEKIFLLTINRLYVFSAEGEFEKKIVLRFIPRDVFILKNLLLFRLYSSDKAFFEVDFDGNILNKFYEPKIVSTKKCKTDFATPGAFLSSGGNFFIMDSLKYHIQIFNLKTRKVEKVLTRKVDFDRLNCIESKIEGVGKAYFYSGGYSWFLENDLNFYYFYRDSNKDLKIDVYGKDNLVLKWTGKYTGEFLPLCINPKNSKFIGFKKGESERLLISNLQSFIR